MSSTILAIDTATEACSVALLKNGQVFSHFEVCLQQHSQRILPLVDEMLTQAGIKLKDVDGLAFGRGPGSFTGVRIGIGIAQGLAFGVDIPVLPISNLQIIAQGAIRRATQSERIAVAIDARMNEVYFAEFAVENGLAVGLTEESVLSPSDLSDHLSANKKATLAVGTGWSAYEANFAGLFSEGLLCAESEAQDGNLPNALDMLPIASQMLQDGQTVRATEAEPVYVRDTVTWKKLPGRE